MPYEEIEMNLIDPNPWQTRKEYDKNALIGLSLTAEDELGIRQAPLVRPMKDGRYQIAFGHGRFRAWKTLKKKTMMCRVEKLTHSQMKKELLVENVNRSDLEEDERFQAIEQYRKDLKLKKERGFIQKLSAATGVPESTLRTIYDVQEMRKILLQKDFDMDEQPSATLIYLTIGLPDDERADLIVKAMDMGWRSATTFKVKKALKSMDTEIRALILEEHSRLSHKVVAAIAEIKDPETQEKVIVHIRTHKYNEELALNLIERVKEGPLEPEIRVYDEVESTLKKFHTIYESFMGWGINQYHLLGQRWDEVLAMIDKMEQKMIELKTLRHRIETGAINHA